MHETAMQRRVRTVLKKEITDFLVTLTTPDAQWPHVSDQQLVDGIADSLLSLGRQRGKGVALLQTLVHELQDRINLELH